MHLTLYTDHDRKVCAWLRQLIHLEAIRTGTVLEGDISDITPYDVEPYHHVHFFAGIGGWEVARELAGWEDPLWTASLPCQPFSQAGQQRGDRDERHLWPVFRELVDQCKPVCVVGEQVASKLGREWFAALQANMEAMGYWCTAVDVGAACVGAPHIRQRLYWCAVRLADVRNTRLERRTLLPECRTKCLAGESSVVSGLADSEKGRWSEINPQSRRSFEGIRTKRNERPEYGGSAGGLANADQRQRGWQSVHGEHEQYRETSRWDERNSEPARDREAGGRAATGSERRQQVPGGPSCDETTHGATRWDRSEPNSNYLVASHGENRDNWSNVIWLSCADGKARPIKPSIKPLVDGVSRGLVQGGDTCNTSSLARVLRLRGYGNSIVPQVAAVFLKSLKEALYSF